METYENYHLFRKSQKRVVGKKNFTYRHTLELVEKYFSQTMKVLDVGCGVGTVDFYLASLGIEVLGIDISKRGIRAAKRDAKGLGLSEKVKFQQMKFPTDKPDGKFDGVLCSEVIEHIQDDKKTITSIYQLLNNDGKLILSTPLETAPLKKLGVLDNFDKEVGHLRRYRVSEIVFLLESVGFEIIEVKLVEGILRNFLFTNKLASNIVRFIKGPLSDMVTLVDDIALKLFGASNVYIIAKK